MTRGSEADAIRAQMAGVRDTLDENVHEIVENARNLTDWRYYVKAAPWGTVAAAVALGYFAVPRKVHVVRPDADQLAELARRHELNFGKVPKTETKSGGPAQAIMTMAANAALRAVGAYLSQQAGKVMGRQAAETPQDQFNAEVRQP